MESDTELTDVIFRKDRNGVYAIFPGLPGTNDPATCLYFDPCGGHGSGYSFSDPPAKPEEYAPVYQTLTLRYGYRLRVVRRMSPHHRQQRAKVLKEATNG